MSFENISGWSVMVCVGFLPGWVYLSVFESAMDSLSKVLYSFYLSLPLNFALAIVLAIFGIFTQPAVFFCYAVILAVGLIFSIRDRFILSWVPRPHASDPWPGKVFFFLCWVLAAGALVYFFRIFWFNMGTIFDYPDERFYNVAALQWADNRLPDPANTSGYPVGIAALWAVNYLLLGTSELQFFNKIYYAVFPLTVAGLFLMAAVRGKGGGALIGLFIFMALCYYHLRYWTGRATLDLPSGCAVLAAYLAFLQYRDGGKNSGQMALILGCAACAAILKQPGYLALALAVGFSLKAVFQDQALSAKEKKILLGFWIPFATWVGFGWWGWIQYQIWLGNTFSESRYLMEAIHEGRNMVERFLHAQSMIFTWPLLKSLNVIVLMVVLWHGRKSPEIRPALFGFILPIYLLWCFYFSYEIRTLGSLLPLVAFCGGVSIQRMLPAPCRTSFRDREISFSCPPIVLLLAAAAMGIVLWKAPRHTYPELAKLQQAKQMEIGDPEVNHFLWNYVQAHPETQGILSQYGTFSSFLWGRSRYRGLPLNTSDNLGKIILRYPGVDLIILDKRESHYGFRGHTPVALNQIEEALNKEELTVLFENQHYRVFRRN